ncbi:MAG TPA: type II secretion system protein GspM [Kiritimatiellia bacterium]|nr:type II secretion system protein GspM [Kiritimatiellia bacterium]
MKLSARELILAAATGAVVLIGGAWYFGAPAMDAWTAARGDVRKTRDDQRLAERLIQQRPEWEARYAELRARIPQYGANDPVTADMLRTVKRLADEHGVSITRIEPDKEKVTGDLSEVAIDCAWDGELDALVRFLYAVQSHPAILDVRQLTVAPAQGAAGRLRGNFTVFFAFSRGVAARPAGTAGTASPGG